jgi:transcriptional regulator with XRE-family HTH domain
MGTAARRKPARLAEKLLTIRTSLGLSQNGMIRRIGFVDEVTQAEISMFERGIRVPSLPVLLEYARAANLYLDVLVDDALDLPLRIPAPTRHEGIKRKSSDSKKGK